MFDRITEDGLTIRARPVRRSRLTSRPTRSLSWDAPANTGGRAVRGYQVPLSRLQPHDFSPHYYPRACPPPSYRSARADWGHQRLCATAARHRERGGARGRERAAAGQVVPSEHPRTRAARTNSRVARRRAKPQGPRVARAGTSSVSRHGRLADWARRVLRGSPSTPARLGSAQARQTASRPSDRRSSLAAPNLLTTARPGRRR